MKLSWLLPLSLLASAPFAAQAQSGPAASQSLRRACAYPTTSSYYSGGGNTRQIYVGLGESCPESYPRSASAQPLPSTARLQREIEIGPVRRCTYEQMGTLWERNLPLERRCPLWAGTLDVAPGAGQPR